MRSMALCVLFAFALLGCERSTEADSGPKRGSQTVKPAPEASKEPIRSLPQVDTSGLDEFAEGIWIDLVNELLSPCGDPVSVARCIAESRKCKRCVPAARYVARLVDDGYSRDEIRDIYRIRYGEDTKLQKLTTHDSPLRGSTMASVTIYEFSDFQCPHCKIASPYLKKIVEESNGKVKLIFKQYPLPGHPKAREAARATIAAHKQGKFWEMHDLLFENQDRLATANLDEHAVQRDRKEDRSRHCRGACGGRRLDAFDLRERPQLHLPTGPTGRLCTRGARPVNWRRNVLVGAE
jgi:hypothetical protein